MRPAPRTGPNPEARPPKARALAAKGRPRRDLPSHPARHVCGAKGKPAEPAPAV
jgi:hypothetical protein